jgi:hypothetical protein
MSGPVGTQVVVRARGLAGNAAKNRIKFGEVDSAVLGCAEDGTRLVTAVPAGAETAAVSVLTDLGQGFIRVDGPVFTVTEAQAPSIESIEPSFGFEGVSTIHWITGRDIRETTVVRIDGIEMWSHFDSDTRLQFDVAFDAGFRAGRHSLILSTPYVPDSAPVEFELRVPLDVGGAQALSATTVRLSFANGPAPDLSVADVRVTGLTITGIQRDPALADTFTLTTSAQEQGRRYYVGVSTRESADGRPLRNRSASFMGWNSSPTDVVATPEVAPDCTAFGLYRPVAIAALGDELVVTEEAGNQFQWMATDESAFARLSAFLGFDGTTFGLHEDPGSVASGCPAVAAGSQPEGFWSPRGAMAADGAALFVSDTGQGRVVRVASGGGTLETVAAGLESPVLMGLWEGRLLVGVASDQVLSIDRDTGAAETFALAGTGDGEVSLGIAAGLAPAAISIGASVYLVEPGNHRVQRFTNGLPTGWIGAGHTNGFESGGSCCSAGTANGEFDEPAGIAVDLAGTLWVADRATGGRLQRFDRDGRFLRSRYLGPNAEPGGIAIDRQNRLWFTIPEAHRAKGLVL